VKLPLGIDVSKIIIKGKSNYGLHRDLQHRVIIPVLNLFVNLQKAELKGYLTNRV
jgi:hypothetical protein